MLSFCTYWFREQKTVITRSKIGIFIGHRQIGKQKTGSSQPFSSTAGSADKPVYWKAGLLAGRAFGSCGRVLPWEGVYVLWRSCSCSLTMLRHLLVGYLLWVCFLPGSSFSSCFSCDGLGSISLARILNRRGCVLFYPPVIKWKSELKYVIIKIPWTL